MKSEAAELVVASTASKSTYAGAAGMVMGWVASSEAAVILGMVVGVLGLLVNWYYKAKSDRRAESLYKARIERIARGYRTDTDLAALGEDD